MSFIPTKIVRIADDITTFNKNLPVGCYCYDVANNQNYVLNVGALSTDTIASLTLAGNITPLGIAPTGLEKFADGTTPTDEGWRLIGNPTTVTGDGAINLMETGDAPQPQMTYVGGTKYRVLTQAQINAMTPEEGTIVWNTDLLAFQLHNGIEWIIFTKAKADIDLFTFSTTITPPTVDGEIRLDNADPTLATAVYVDYQNKNIDDVSTFLAGVQIGATLGIRGASQFASYTVTAVTDQTTYYEYTVTYNTSDLTVPFVNGQDIRLTGVVPLTDAPSGLEKITEGGNTGWRLIGANPANYGDIGRNAIDMSHSDTTSSTRGATNENCVAFGRRTTASGFAGSFATGSNTVASGQYSATFGTSTVASGVNSTAFGGATDAIGNSSFVGGGGAGASRIQCSGEKSFAFQGLESTDGTFDNAADNAAILGGRMNSATVAATRSVVLGGITQSATLPDTVYYPKGKLQGQAADPTGLVAADEGLFWYNTTDHKFSFYDGTAIAPLNATGLETVTEGGNTGWRLIGANAANVGDTGAWGIDFSEQTSASTTRGATGTRSMAIGFNTTASGNQTFAGGQTAISSGGSSFAFGTNVTAGPGVQNATFGNGCTSSGNYAFSAGFTNTASGISSAAFNQRAQATGNYSFAAGFGETAADYPRAATSNSFIFQQVQAGQGVKEAAAFNSAILGGLNNEVVAGANTSVVLGGSNQSATLADTVYLPHLKFQGRAADPVGLGAADAGAMWYDTTLNKMKFWTGTAVEVITSV